MPETLDDYISCITCEEYYSVFDYVPSYEDFEPHDEPWFDDEDYWF